MAYTAEKKLSFGLKLLLYIISFLIVGAVLLLVFYDFLAEYESTRINHTLEQYKSELVQNGPTDACMNAAFRCADRKLFTEDEIRSFVSSLLADVEFRKMPSESTEEKAVYKVASNAYSIGSVTFLATNDARFGCTSWKISEENYDFSLYCEESSVILPPDYTASVNDITLDESYITSHEIEFDTLKDFYHAYPSLPYKTEYSTGMQLGAQEFVLKDAEGAVVQASEITEEAYLNSQKPDDYPSLKAFSDDFITNYVQFTADVDGSHYYYYYTLLSLCVEDSELQERIKRAIDSFGFTLTKQCDITDITYNFIIQLDATHYLADLTYSTSIVGRGEVFHDSRNVRLVITSADGQYLAESMNNY